MGFRFRLIQCRTCGWRTWSMDKDGKPQPEDWRGHEHDDLWEEHTFFGHDDDGPGFALKQAES